MVDLEPQLKDSEGNTLRKDQLVRDDVFGEGLTRGTVALDSGKGHNVLIDWRHAAPPGDPRKPKSRGSQFLTIVGGTATGRTHTGAAFESGQEHRRRGVNDADASGLDARFNSWGILTEGGQGEED